MTETKNENVTDGSPSPIAYSFGLSHGNYLVLHRTLLQSMPRWWQAEFLRLAGELNTAFDLPENMPSFDVRPCDWVEDYTQDEDGNLEWNGYKPEYRDDPIPHYNQTRIQLPVVREPTRSDAPRELPEEVKEAVTRLKCILEQAHPLDPTPPRIDMQTLRTILTHLDPAGS